MPPGADKIISYDPPGAIGLNDTNPLVLIRFDETDAAALPSDSAGNLLDMGLSPGFSPGLAQSTIVPGVTGSARHFDAGIGSGMMARDRTPGTTLATRDVTVQAIAKWVASDQAGYGTTGVLVTRGAGIGSSLPGASETTSFALMFSTFTAALAVLPAGQGRMHFTWEEVGGSFREDTGAIFVSPIGFTLFTATRRWVSPTSVIMRYYVGDVLIGETTSTNGNIGGGTTGTTAIGTVPQAPTQNFGRTFCGDLDELLIVRREMCAEEIENTWLRLTKYQPSGTQLFIEMHDDGFPMSRDSSSDIQLDTRMIGQALGYAASTAENLRANFLPGRAYGQTLEQWEQAVAVTPKPAQSLDQRRARVLARLQQRNGASPTGITQAIGDLLDLPANTPLQYIAFDNTWLDDFTTLNLLRWDLTPTACATAVSGKLHFAPGTGTFTALNGGWRTAAATVSRSNEFATYSGEHALAKLTMTTPQSGCEAGVFFSNRQTNDHLLLGLRDTAGTFEVFTESFIGGVSQGAFSQGLLGGNPSSIWLHLYQEASVWKAAFSVTSRTTGYFGPFTILHPGMVHWAGCYLRSTGAIAAAVADFDDFTLRTPDGNRPLVAYVYRNPAYAGAPDIDGAESVLQGIAHAYTEVHLIQSLAFRADIDPTDTVPMGAL